MSYSDKKMAKIIRTGGGLSIGKVKPRKKSKGILGMLSSTPKRRRGVTNE